MATTNNTQAELNAKTVLDASVNAKTVVPNAEPVTPNAEPLKLPTINGTKLSGKFAVTWDKSDGTPYNDTNSNIGADVVARYNALKNQGAKNVRTWLKDSDNVYHPNSSFLPGQKATAPKQTIDTDLISKLVNGASELRVAATLARKGEYDDSVKKELLKRFDSIANHTAK